MRPSMKKTLKPIFFIVILGLVGLGGYFLYKSLVSGTPAANFRQYEWVTIDENYTPKNYIEEFIKNDSAEKKLFPVSIKNYGRENTVLRRFIGSNFARPTEAQLNMMFKNLEDWMIIELKYKTKQEREVLRTVLYVQVDGTWRVGDSGSLSLR